MKYLFFEVWLLLLLAFSLGWFCHWLFRWRTHGKDKSPAGTAAREPHQSPASQTDMTVNEKWRPAGLANRPEVVDDLKRIKGIGPAIEQSLQELGIYQFEQIANWSQDNILWIEDFISFPGRIMREEWVTQADILQRGGSTEFASRVDEGAVDYD
ncbi:MAG: hypothetical protein HKN85_03995 [Gammaproteobacteria bacterium]|nr:hypothetical protein [Gammaproteobacteria bacterium]